MLNRAVVAVFAAVALPAPAAAQTAKITALTFDLDGHPLVVANPHPDGSKGSVSWSICRPGSDCQSGGSERVLRAGEQPAGTVFEATVDYQGQRTSDRSPPWGGRVTATAAPTLGGRPVVGERVVPRGASWSGGWGDEYSGVRVQACRTIIPRVPSCITLSASRFVTGPADGGVVLRPRHVGWFLFGVDQRFADDSVFPAISYGRPENVPPLEPSASQAFSAPYGPVTGPTAALRPRVRFRGGRPVLGRVRCPARCRVRLVVWTGDARYVRRLRVERSERLVARVGRGARPGRWQVAVWSHGRRLAARLIKVRR